MTGHKKCMANFNLFSRTRIIMLNKTKANALVIMMVWGLFSGILDWSKSFWACLMNFEQVSRFLDPYLMAPLLIFKLEINWIHIQNSKLPFLLAENVKLTIMKSQQKLNLKKKSMTIRTLVKECIAEELFDLFDLILYVPSTLFQL